MRTNGVKRVALHQDQREARCSPELIVKAFLRFLLATALATAVTHDLIYQSPNLHFPRARTIGTLYLVATPVTKAIQTSIGSIKFDLHVPQFESV